MLILQVTLVVKIILTATLWSLLPLLRPRLAAPSGDPTAVALARGLGATNLALLVMYAFGLAQTFEGIAPWFAVCAGLVSNGLGALLSFTILRSGRLKGRSAKINRFNTAALTAITAGLIAGSVAVLV
jgi:hypothetical protein